MSQIRNPGVRQGCFTSTHPNTHHLGSIPQTEKSKAEEAEEEEEEEEGALEEQSDEEEMEKEKSGNFYVTIPRFFSWNQRIGSLEKEVLGNFEKKSITNLYLSTFFLVFFSLR